MQQSEVLENIKSLSTKEILMSFFVTDTKVALLTAASSF